MTSPWIMIIRLTWFILTLKRHLTVFLTMNYYLNWNLWASLEIYDYGINPVYSIISMQCMKINNNTPIYCLFYLESLRTVSMVCFCFSCIPGYVSNSLLYLFADDTKCLKTIIWSYSLRTVTKRYQLFKLLEWAMESIIQSH